MAIKEDRDINCQFHILEREEKHKLIHVCGKIIEKNNERSTVCGYFMDLDSMKKMNH